MRLVRLTVTGLAMLVLAGTWPLMVHAKSTAPDYRAALAASQAVIGKPVGQFRLTDSNGARIDLADLHDKPLVVQFIYTGCFQACPVATQFLADAVRQARAALGAASFRVAAIGFNQPFDSPQAMADFERRNSLGVADWYFLSPLPEDVDRLTARFGFTYEATPKGFDHIAQISVVDTDGRIFRQVYGSEFALPMLVGPLKEVLGGAAASTVSLQDIWLRVKLYCTVYDPHSGGYRINYSLFFQIFAGVTVLGSLIWFVVHELRRSGAP